MTTSLVSGNKISIINLTSVFSATRQISNMAKVSSQTPRKDIRTLNSKEDIYLTSLHRDPISESSFPLKSAQLCKQSSCKEGRSNSSMDESLS